MSTPTTARELRLQLSEVVAAYDAAVVSGPAAARDVAEFARIEKLAAAGRMAAAGRVEETQAWIGSGHRSPQDWLAGEAGTSVAEAAGVLETSKRLKGLAATAEAVRAGDLSAGQARAVAGAAAADPGAEEQLLATARRETFKGLRDEADRVRAAATDDAARQAWVRARRSFRQRVGADGANVVTIYGPAADGVRLAEQLRPFEEQVFREARTAARVTGERPTYENRAYDAFMRFVGITDQPAPPARAGVPGTGEEVEVEPDGNDPERPASTERPAGVATCTCGGGGASGAGRVPRGANTKVIVRIDHTALCRGHAVAGETVEVVGVGPVPVATVHDLMDDAFLAAVVTKGHDVVNVAHLGRTVNAHQRTALEAMRLQCSNIACNATVGTEIDHRTPWADHPETRLDNQDPLCRADHDRKTHHGWTLEPGTGRRRFLPPDHPDRDRRGQQGQRGQRGERGQRGQRGEPPRADPARAGPARAGPAGGDPARAGPARAGPARAGPEPAGLVPAAAESAGSVRPGPGPVGPELPFPGPVGSMRPGPGPVGPVRPGPGPVGPGPAGPVRAGPLRAGPR